MQLDEENKYLHNKYSEMIKSVMLKIEDKSEQKGIPSSDIFCQSCNLHITITTPNNHICAIQFLSQELPVEPSQPTPPDHQLLNTSNQMLSK
jgi:hypothetical protein